MEAEIGVRAQEPEVPDQQSSGSAQRVQKGGGAGRFGVDHSSLGNLIPKVASISPGGERCASVKA